MGAGASRRIDPNGTLDPIDGNNNQKQSTENGTSKSLSATTSKPTVDTSKGGGASSRRSSVQSSAPVVPRGAQNPDRATRTNGGGSSGRQRVDSHARVEISTVFPPPLTSIERSRIDDIISLLVDNKEEALKNFLLSASNFSWNGGGSNEAAPPHLQRDRNFQSPSSMGFTKKRSYSLSLSAPNELPNSDSAQNESSIHELLLPNKDMRNIWHYMAVVWNYVSPAMIEALFDWTEEQFAGPNRIFNWLSLLFSATDIFGYAPMHVILFHYAAFENLDCLLSLLLKRDILQSEDFSVGIRIHATPIGEPTLSRAHLFRQRQLHLERTISNSKQLDLVDSFNMEMSQLDISDIPASDPYASTPVSVKNSQSRVVAQDKSLVEMEEELAALEESKSTILSLRKEDQRQFTFKWESKRFGGQRKASRSAFVQKYTIIFNILKSYIQLQQAGATKKKLQKHLATNEIPTNFNPDFIVPLHDILECFLLVYHESPLFTAVFKNNTAIVNQILEESQTALSPQPQSTSNGSSSLKPPHDFVRSSFSRSSTHPKIIVESVALAHSLGFQEALHALLQHHSSFVNQIFGSEYLALLDNFNQTRLTMRNIADAKDIHDLVKFPLRNLNVNTTSLAQLQSTQYLLDAERAIKEEILLIHELCKTNNGEVVENYIESLFQDPVLISYEEIIYPENDRFSQPSELQENTVKIPIKSPLDLACMYGFKSVVETALTNGETPEENHLILSLASDHADLTLSLITEEGVIPGNRLLLLACMINDANVAKECLRYVEGSYAHVFTALKRRSTDVLDILMNDAQLHRELIAASIEIGSISSIERYYHSGMKLPSLRNYDASVDIKRALQLRYTSIAEYLFIQEKRSFRRAYEHLIVCECIRNDNIEALRKFLSHLLFETKKYQSQKEEKTHRVLRKVVSETKRTLTLSNGEVIPDNSDWLEGVDPLYMCVVRGQTHNLRLILEHPVRIESSKNLFREDFSVIHIAASHGHHQLIQYLFENFFSNYPKAKQLVGVESCDRLGISEDTRTISFLKGFIASSKFNGKSVMEEVHLQRFLKEYFERYLVAEYDSEM